MLIDKLASRPSLADDEVFEVEVERRFLLWYKCIRRTRPMTIDQVRTGDREYPPSRAVTVTVTLKGSVSILTLALADCALSLYDGEQFSEMLEDRIEIGEIMFTLRSDATSEDVSSEDKASFTTYSEKSDSQKDHKRR